MNDPKAVVAASYDCIVDPYLNAFARSVTRDRKLGELIAGLGKGARVLDLGCGAGVPVLRNLVDKGFHATGVDGSARQIERARTLVPEASLICADMTCVKFPPDAFDAVSAFYAMTHVPRGEHACLLRHIANWLRPGGLFLASFGAEEGDWSGQWLDVPMFFSHHAPGVAERLVREAGLAIERSEVLQQDNEPTKFLWITAKRESG